MGKLINIDGSKLKTLLESATGKTLATLGVENGYSKSILTNAVRRNTASPAVVALVRLYGIEPSAYEVREVTTLRALEAERERKQLTLDDLVRDDVRAELKAIFKETIIETLSEFRSQAINWSYDRISQEFAVCIKVSKPVRNNTPVKDPDRFII